MKFNDSTGLIRSLVWKVLSGSVAARVVHLIGEPFFMFQGRRQKGRDIDLSQVKHALIVRLDEIGDMVMTAPFLRELRRNLPEAWLTLVVKPSNCNLVELCPYVDEVLTYDRRSHGWLSQFRRHGRALQLAWRHLGPRRFDLAVLPRWNTDLDHGTFLVYYSGAPWRVGYSEKVSELKQRRNKGFDRLLTDVLDHNALQHEVQRNLDVLRFLGAKVQDAQLELWVGEDDEAFARRILHEARVQPRELVVGLSPSGGNSPLKEWPTGRFIELGRRLQEQFGSHLLVIGGPGEETLGREIEREIGSSVTNAVGKTTLRQMAALLKACHLYVGSDSGPMHVAAAVGTPVVALFGASCPHCFGPWGDGHKIIWSALPCSPCTKTEHLHRCSHCIHDRPYCMLDITVDQVQRAVNEIVHNRTVFELEHARKVWDAPH